MRTTYYIAAALAALNLANAISLTATSSSLSDELQQFSTELAQIDSDLAALSDSELDSYTDKGKTFVPGDVADINDMLQGGHEQPTNGLVLPAVRRALRSFGAGEPTVNDKKVTNWGLFATSFDNAYTGYKAENAKNVLGAKALNTVKLKNLIR